MDVKPVNVNPVEVFLVPHSRLHVTVHMVPIWTLWDVRRVPVYLIRRVPHRQWNEGERESDRWKIVASSSQPCWELSEIAKSHNHSTGLSCAQDGSFSARQCDQSKCWCVTPTGIPISGFESQPAENVNCGKNALYFSLGAIWFS